MTNVISTINAKAKALTTDKGYLIDDLPFGKLRYSKAKNRAGNPDRLCS